jgi:RimJ/RimL family protein N-acetyltransferase
MVGWLDAQHVSSVTAHIHPEHAASAAVASSAGLRPTDVIEDGEVVWRRVNATA